MHYLPLSLFCFLAFQRSPYLDTLVSSTSISNELPMSFFVGILGWLTRMWSIVLTIWCYLWEHQIIYSTPRPKTHVANPIKKRLGGWCRHLSRQ
jgi:hypothetical protein